MMNTLKEKVVPNLLNKGFKGTFPHYKKIYDDKIELLAFQTNKYGNSFTVEISTIFPNEQNMELKNFYTGDFKAFDEISVFDTSNRFRLKGLFDGWFYYSDVYHSKIKAGIFRKIDFYEAVSEKRAVSYTPKDGEVLVQKFSDELFLVIADEVNRQMQAAYAWWEKHNTPRKMKYLK